MIMSESQGSLAFTVTKKSSAGGSVDKSSPFGTLSEKSRIRFLPRTKPCAWCSKSVDLGSFSEMVTVWCDKDCHNRYHLWLAVSVVEAELLDRRKNAVYAISKA